MSHAKEFQITPHSSARLRIVDSSEERGAEMGNEESLLRKGTRPTQPQPGDAGSHHQC